MSMNSRLQPVLCVMVLGLLAGPSLAAEPDPYLPNNTEAVLTINVKQVLQAPFLKEHLDKVKAAFNAVGDVKKVLTELGFDPFTDVDSVVFGAPGGNDAENVMILVHGKFDLPKFTAKAEKAVEEHKELLKIVKEGTYTFYQVTPPGNQDQTMFVALVDGATLVSSKSKDFVIDALDKKAGKKKSELKKELVQLLEKSDAKRSLSIVALGGTGGQGREFTDKLNHITGGINIIDDVKAEFLLAAKNDQDAKSVSDMIEEGLQQGKAMAQFLAGQKNVYAPLIDVLDSVKVATQGKSVTVKGQVTQEMLDKAVKGKPGKDTDK